ncbi:hypothetical protein ACO0KY_18335 [Undibacterium sp. Dicai25W]|uniref:hypothetical protein n=1 Tax=Undibacterium sp. Dicai25W TaxID=3413034 RepID=UPI003BF3F6D2
MTLKLKQKIRFISLSLLCLAQTISATVVDFPDDVTAFLADREVCNHWRGEDGYDAERQADIDWAICTTCQGTDTKLSLLKKKYRGNKDVLEKLNQLEPKIEPEDKAATKEFCKKTRKPAYQK